MYVYIYVSVYVYVCVCVCVSISLSLSLSMSVSQGLIAAFGARVLADKYKTEHSLVVACVLLVACVLHVLVCVCVCVCARARLYVYTWCTSVLLQPLRVARFCPSFFLALQSGHIKLPQMPQACCGARGQQLVQ